MGEPNMKVESKPRGVDRHKYVCFGLVRNWMCVRLIIGEGREGEMGGKRSVDRLIQSNLGGREGTATQKVSSSNGRGYRGELDRWLLASRAASCHAFY